MENVINLYPLDEWGPEDGLYDELADIINCYVDDYDLDCTRVFGVLAELADQFVDDGGGDDDDGLPLAARLA